MINMVLYMTSIIKNIHFRYILTILFLLIYIYCQRNCSNSDTSSINNTIITKPKKGSFEKISIKEVKPKIKFKYKTISGETIYLENPINIDLAKKYENDTDSLKRRLMYYEAIQQRKYTGRIKDKNLKLDFEAYTTGTLDSLKVPSYEIFSDTIPIKPVKETKLAIYLGGGIYNNSQFNNAGFKIDLGIQNKKGDILFIGYDPFNKNYFVEYKLRLINIKK
jgi:hypothetical protein